MLRLQCLLAAALFASSAAAQPIPIADGWARTKVNCAIFRKNALCSRGEVQYAAFYDAEARVVLAKRVLGARDWQVRVTPYRGKVADAHKSISIAVDGDGLLHMAWDQHNNPLRYCRSVAPGSLELTDQQSMIGDKESRVTYPEFYLMPNGDLLFFYRDGSSGNGDLVLNRYDVRQKKWIRLQDNLLGGEGRCNAYWQVAVDRQAAIHLSWVWRETGDVVTNHDIAYAKSADGGKTWTRTTGEAYRLPITQATAEYAARIPQNSELANQTSMAIDDHGHPYIANFWRDNPAGVPQYRVVYHDGSQWQTRQVGTRTLDFRRQGGGTKRPPISRPAILFDGQTVLILFRDQERGPGFTLSRSDDKQLRHWKFEQVTQQPVGQSDPLYDPNLWTQKRQLHLLTQFVGQGDGEKEENVPPQMVSVVEWTPKR